MSKFNEWKKAEQITFLLHYLEPAIRDFVDRGNNIRTDVIGVALQYGGAIRPKVKREDFEVIKKMTVEELIKEVEDYYKEKKKK
jgi:hypothetical protein